MSSLLFFSCQELPPISSNPRLISNNQEDLKFPRFDVHKKILDNGLTILFLKKSKVPIFSFYNFVKVGSHYETEGITGAAHFLEHLMFLGGKKYKVGEFDLIMSGNGGSSNAYTQQDLTVYYENLPVPALDKILDMEADRLQYLALDQTAFEKERNVILEERKSRYENSPEGQIFQETISLMYRGTPYEESVIGKIKDLKSVSRDQIRTFYQKFYAPNNMVMVIVGDFEKDFVFSKMEDYFSKLKKNNELENEKKTFDDLNLYNNKLANNISKKLYGNSKIPLFYLAINGYGISDKRAPVLDLLSVMLGHGKSSFLNQSYVTNPTPVLSSAQSFHYSLKNSGLFIISGRLLEQNSVDDFEKELKKYLPTFCKEAITPRNVTKTKNQFLVSYYDGLQKTSEIAGLLGKYEATSGNYNDYLKDIKIIDEIQIEDLQKACNELIMSKKQLFVSLWDKHPVNNKKDKK